MGKKIPRQAVTVYRVYIYHPRRFEKAKNEIIKKLAVLIEFLAN